MESNGATSRAVVVTGTSIGIGRAIATTLAGLGWTVRRYRPEPGLLEEALGEIGGVAVAGDVRDLEVLRTARRAAEERGELRAWINNAAVVRLAPLHLMGPDVITELLDINLTAAVLGSREALCSFGQPGGWFDYQRVFDPRPEGLSGYGAYDTAKGGMEALTRYVCTEYGHLGIRCNAIAPGPVRTNIVAPVAADEPKPASFAAEAEDLSPMHRISEPTEIAETVAFLLDDRTVSINGHVLAIDNGMSAWAFGFPPDELVAFAAEP